MGDNPKILGFFPWEREPFPEWQAAVSNDARLGRIVIDTTPGNAAARDALLVAMDLDRPMCVFVREVCFFRWGYWKELRLSLDEHALEGSSTGLALERDFLRLLCEMREGKPVLGTAREESLRAAATAGGAPWISDILAFEMLSGRVRLGRYRENLPRLSELLHSLGTVSVYWAFRLRISIAAGEQALGLYASCEKSLREAHILLRRTPSAALLATLFRRRISLALEREHFDEARALFPEALALARGEGFHTEQALLLQEHLRMCITDGSESAIHAAFSELETCVQRAGLPAAFMSLIEERCELALRTEKSAETIALLADFVEGATARKEVAGVCVGRMYQARALHAQRDSVGARARLDEALRLAREQEYGKARVRILFYASALARENGERVRARLLLEEAGGLAARMGLPVQMLCHRFAAENIEADKPSLGPLIEALGSLAAFRELFHYLKFYGFFASRRVRLSLGERVHETRSLEEFLAGIRSTPALYWFERERVLVCCGSSVKPITLKLDERFPVDAGTAFLLRRASVGATSEQLHQLSYRKVHYHADIHGGRLRMLVSRVRERLSPLGCEVVHERASGRYFVRAGVPLVAVSASEDAGAAGDAPALREREKEILELLRREGRLTTAALCARLGVTRQTLHPWLTRLNEARVIRAFGHGRARAHEAL